MTGDGTTTNFEAQDRLESFAVCDTSGNRTVVQERDCIVDATAPVVEGITYANGSYTIRIRDDESGIWKITDRIGKHVYKTYA